MMMPTICNSPFAISLFVAITWSVASGFSTVTSRGQFTASTTRIAVTAEVSEDLESALLEGVDPHDIIGVEPDLLAIGINATEFLLSVGT